ncbi:hypothetical protein [Pleurocapsa sp. PCC 7319]|nr:hypothetical protein [Pleurocapsa sp. PCC 7319]
MSINCLCTARKIFLIPWLRFSLLATALIVEQVILLFPVADSYRQEAASF